MTRQIKQRVDELLVDPNVKNALFRIFTVVAIVSLVPTLLENLSNTYASFIAGVATIILIPFNHGVIVASLKVVRNNSEALEDQDAIVGITRFRDLFTTYFLKGLFEYIIVFLISFIGLFVFIGANITLVNTLIEVLPSLTSGDTSTLINYLSAFVTNNASFVLGIFLLLIVSFVVSLLIELYLFAVPYLLEQYNMKNMQAIKTSYQLMKGHILELIKLELSYVPMIIICAILSALIMSLVSSVISSALLANIISYLATAVLGVYLYEIKYNLAKTVFFEEITYKDFE